MIYPTLIFLCVAVIILAWRVYLLEQKVKTLLNEKAVSNKAAPSPPNPRAAPNPRSKVSSIRPDIDPWREN